MDIGHRLVERDGQMLVDFTDMEDFWNTADLDAGDGMARASRASDDSFYGPPFDKARLLARYGWPEGAGKMRELSVHIQECIGSRILVEEMRHDVCGEFADVQEYILGRPESMVRIEPAVEAGKGRIVNVVFNGGISSGISKETCFARGAVAVAVVDAICRSGLLAELTYLKLDSDNGSSDHGIGLVVPIKRADEPLNLDRLAFCMAHVSMQRRMVFSVLELMPRKLKEKYGFFSAGSYAYSIDPPQGQRGDVYFEKMRTDDASWCDKDAAIDKTLEILRAQGLAVEV